MDNRPKLSEVWMNLAKELARRSTCSSKIRVGAVLVSEEGFVVATGYNGSPSGQPHCDDVGHEKDVNGKCVRAIHAEMNALLQCARRGVSSEGCTLYITHKPCPRCTQALVQAGVAAVIYEEDHGYAEERRLTALFVWQSGLFMRERSQLEHDA